MSSKFIIDSMLPKYHQQFHHQQLFQVTTNDFLPISARLLTADGTIAIIHPICMFMILINDIPLMHVAIQPIQLIAITSRTIPHYNFMLSIYSLRPIIPVIVV